MYVLNKKEEKITYSMKDMSFSKKMKEELSKINNLTNKDAVKSEFIGYLISNNTNVIKNKIKYSTESEFNINRFSKLLNNLNIDYTIELQGKTYIISFNKVAFEEIEYNGKKIQICNEKFNIENDLTKRAFIRGTFLGGGSLNNPSNKYHLEVVLSNLKNAEVIIEILNSFDIHAKILERKNATSIYIKDSEEISKFLALIGANKAVLDFEEIRVVRDTRNNVNRLVNCETANLNKIVNAAVEQIQNIEYLKKIKKFEELPENLKQIANVRIENPEASLVELGQMLENPIGKSGVNHRLKKICEIAEEFKTKKDK